MDTGTGDDDLGLMTSGAGLVVESGWLGESDMKWPWCRECRVRVSGGGGDTDGEYLALV